MSRYLFLARHGETAWNQLGRWQGQTDVDLNDAGRAQARVLAEHLRDRGLVAVWSSDLSRARETAEIVGQVLGVPGGVNVDPGLRERGFGCFEGLTREECESRFPELWSRYKSNLREVPTGGEAHTEVVPRMHGALRRVAATLTEGQAALIVSHGAAIRLAIGEITGEIPGPLGNGALFRLTVEVDRFGAVERVV